MKNSSFFLCLEVKKNPLTSFPASLYPLVCHYLISAEWWAVTQHHSQQLRIMVSNAYWVEKRKH
jgi:hypothetical protein